MTLGRPGELLGSRYRLDRYLGGGGSAERWQAFDERLARPVSVRLSPADPDEDGDGQHSPTLRAALAGMARLNHPGVAAVYDVGTADGRGETRVGYAVSEWTEGRTLGQIMTTGPQPWPRAADWGKQIAGGLAALHAIGLVHGALGPNSVAVHDDRQVKIMDAGLDFDADEEPGDEDCAPSDGDSGKSAPDAGKSEEQSAAKSGAENDAAEIADSDESAEAEDAGDDAGTAGEEADDADEKTESASETTALAEGDGVDADDHEPVAVPVGGKLPEGSAEDVRALGLLLCAAITGVHADADAQTRVGDSLESLVGDGAVLDGADRSALLEAGAPPELADLLAEMTGEDPAARPTAAAVQRRFAPFAVTERIAEDGTRTTVLPASASSRDRLAAVPAAAAGTRLIVGGPRPPAPPPRDEPAARRRGLIVGIALLVAAIGVGVGLLVANLSPGNAANPNPNITDTPIGSSPGSVQLPSNAPSSANQQPSTGSAQTSAPAHHTPTSVATSATAPTNSATTTTSAAPTQTGASASSTDPAGGGSVGGTSPSPSPSPSDSSASPGTGGGSGGAATGQPVKIGNGTAP